MHQLLIVEDSPTQAELLRSTVEDAGFSVLVARDAEVGGYLSFDECTAHGAIRLSRAKVGAEIDLSGGRFINPGDDAIRCRNTAAPRPSARAPPASRT